MKKMTPEEIQKEMRERREYYKATLELQEWFAQLSGGYMLPIDCVPPSGQLEELALSLYNADRDRAAAGL